MTIAAKRIPTTIVELEQLRQMIGMLVRYRGMTCQVLEVLEDGPSLVLISAANNDFSIQGDQHGEAHRIVKNTYTVPVLSPDSTEFSPAFLSLEPIE